MLNILSHLFCRTIIALILFTFLSSVTLVTAHAAIFNPTTGAELEADISTADANGEADKINLTEGVTYTLSDQLSITSEMTINGNGATIERGAADPSTFRLIIVMDAGDLTVNNVTLRGGKTTTGSGIFNYGELTLSDCTVEKNEATTVDGGGLYNHVTGNATITNCTFFENSATANHGGAISNQGTLTIKRSNFNNNTAATAMNGGAIRTAGLSPSVKIDQSTFFQNNAGSNGGAIYVYSGKLTVTNSAFIENSTTGTANSGTGGAVRNASKGNAYFYNTTFYNNIARSGGAIAVSSSNATTFTNCTITENETKNGGQGGGIRTIGISPPVLKNTILSGNISAAGDPNCDGEITSSGNNIIGDTSGCTIVATDGDLFDGAVTENGLSPFVSSAEAGQSHFPLMDNSQAINAGDPSICIDNSGTGGVDLSVDQLLNKRDSSCDVGSVESVCGDSIIQTVLGEECEDGNIVDNDGCSSDCHKEVCGDGYKVAIEECDGDNLNGQTCQTQGFDKGTLSCTDGCLLDTSSCSNNGSVDPSDSDESDAVATPKGGCSLIRGK